MLLGGTHRGLVSWNFRVRVTVCHTVALRYRLPSDKVSRVQVQLDVGTSCPSPYNWRQAQLEEILWVLSPLKTSGGESRTKPLPSC